MEMKNGTIGHRVYCINSVHCGNGFHHWISDKRTYAKEEGEK